jgi:hypothetical protein
MIEVVEQLLDRFVAVLGSLSESEEERENFFAVTDSLSYAELLDLMTGETITRLREHVVSPAALVLTLN